MARSETNPADEPAVVALHALAWILGDPGRTARFVDLTGLDAATLRARAGHPALLAAVIDHLAAREADLIACAGATDTTPDALIRAGKQLKAS